MLQLIHGQLDGALLIWQVTLQVTASQKHSQIWFCFLICHKGRQRFKYEPHHEIYEKTKVQTSFAVTAELISTFVFASTISLLSTSQISSLWPSSMIVQLGFCQTFRKPHLIMWLISFLRPSMFDPILVF